MNKYYVKNLPRTDLISVIRKLKEADVDRIFVPKQDLLREIGADFDIIIQKDKNTYPLEVKQIYTSRGIYFVKKPGQHDNVIIMYNNELYTVKNQYKEELMALHIQYKKQKNYPTPYDIKEPLPITRLEKNSENILTRVLEDFDIRKLHPVSSVNIEEKTKNIDEYKDFSYARVKFSFLQKTHVDNATLFNYNIIIKDEKLLEKAKAYNPNPKPRHYELLD